MMTQRREVVVDENKYRVQTGSVPNIHEDEALIRLRLGGICSTDLALIRGYKNFNGVLGHEFVGDVVQGPPNWMGQRVVGEINIVCGECDNCLRGLPSHCRRRRILGLSGDYDGAFADIFHLPLDNLHRVPANMTDEEAVFTEPVAAAVQIMEQIHIAPMDDVLVLGVGRLGMLVSQILHQQGVKVTGVVRHQRQIELLGEWGIVAQFRSDLGDECADLVVDCTGSQAGFVDALSLVRPRGIVVLKSTYEGIPQADLTKIAVNEITVIGSRCGPFEAALRVLPRIDVQRLVDGVYSLDEAPKALEHAAQSGVLKILLRR